MSGSYPVVGGSSPSAAMKEGGFMYAKILSLFFFIAFAPCMAYATPNDFMLIEGFPSQINAGTNIQASYRIICEDATEALFSFTLDLRGQGTQNMQEFPGREIYFNDVLLDCMYLSHADGFFMECPVNLTFGVHVISVRLSVAHHMAPDVFDYSSTLTHYIEDVPAVIPVQTTHFSTGGGGGWNTELPQELETTVVYLSHLENTSYEQYEYQAPVENETDVSISSPPDVIYTTLNETEMADFLDAIEDEKTSFWDYVVLLCIAACSMTLGYIVAKTHFELKNKGARP